MSPALPVLTKAETDRLLKVCKERAEKLTTDQLLAEVEALEHSEEGIKALALWDESFVRLWRAKIDLIHAVDIFLQWLPEDLSKPLSATHQQEIAEHRERVKAVIRRAF